jgi:ATP-binding cassette, subfamily B, bacterial HlyB/CyaB
VRPEVATSSAPPELRAIPSQNGGLLGLAQVAAFHSVQTTPRQLVHELALGNQPVGAEELVRGAKLIGLKARVVRDPTAKRLRGIPVPALIKLRDGRWVIFGMEKASGRFRVVYPLTGREEELPLADILERLDRDVVLIGKGMQLSAEQFKFSLAWFLPTIKRYRRPLTDVFVASLFIQLLGLAVPLSFQLVVDKVLVHKSFSTLVVVISALVLLSVFEGWLKYLRVYILNHTSNRIDVELGARLFAHLLRLPISYFESRPAGVIVTRAREIENVRRFLTGRSIPSAIDLCFVFVYVGVLFLYSVQLTCILMLMWPLYIFIGGVLRPAFRRKVKDKFRRWSATQELLVESVVGIQTLKAAAVEPMFQRKWEERLSAYVRDGFATAVLGARAQTATEFVSRLTTALILFFGVQAVIVGTLTIGQLIAFVLIANRITQPILRTAQLWQDFQEVQVSVEHLGDILNAPLERTSQPLTGLPPAQGALEFRAMSFRYSPDLPEVVKSFSLSIKVGEMIGIVGPSGSGKSTLAKLVQRLYEPTSGEIFLDGIDIMQVDTAWLRRQLGVVLQENFLFKLTVHDNIALARPDMSRAEVVAVARLSGADEFVKKLPQGYDTLVQERGANLSGGQRQRIAIARALATDPRVLILDEATSALDYESERIIRANMRQIARARTVIIIAHRLAAVRDCDRIIGMIDGAITEVGTHHALLTSRDGLYARLWAIQNEHAKP